MRYVIAILLLWVAAASAQPVIIPPPTAASSGDITDVFSCSTGDCSSITMGASDFLDMSGATPSNSSGLKLPATTNCSGLTGEGVIAWKSDSDEICVGDGATTQTFSITGGDITDVFGCTTGDCSSITMGSGDFLDMSGATPSNTSGLKLPPSADCSGVTGEGVTCWKTDTDDWIVGTGSGNVTFLKSTSITLDGAFDNGKVIDGANSQANGFRVGDGTDYWGFFIDAGG